MKRYYLIGCLFVASIAQAQDYLTSFANIQGEKTEVILEEFLFFTIEKIGSSPDPYVVALNQMSIGLPAAFLPLYQEVRLQHNEDTMIEIEYKVCVDEHCVVRYNLSTTDGYQRGEVFETGKPLEQNGLNIKAMAEMLTLLELIALLDINNINQDHPAWQSLKNCYRPNLYMRADIGCLVEKLEKMSEDKQRSFLNSVLN